jgi:hypothetical protein
MGRVRIKKQQRSQHNADKEQNIHFNKLHTPEITTVKKCERSIIIITENKYWTEIGSLEVTS